MKKIVLLIISLGYSILSIAQQNTKITINIPQPDSSKLEAQIFIENPLKPINTGFYKDTLQLTNGKCQFLFKLENTSFVTLTLNEKFVTFPGAYEILVSPGDSLVFDLPSIKNTDNNGFGLKNIKITGIGNEKVNLTKDIVTNYFKIFETDLPYQKQSITYKYQTTDRKFNVIDSIYRSDKKVEKSVKNLIKAQLYSYLMESLYRSSLRSESDSLHFLFKKYIVNRKRMEIFYKNGVINYSGAGSIASYLVLSAYKNPVRVGGDDFSKKHKLEYAELINKGLAKDTVIRDYILSRFLISAILSRFDTTTKKLYQYYVDHVSFNNPNYSNVVDTYQETERKFAVGKPFYDFSLPDSTGKIFSLKDFNGKVLVIDFWYNGCGGCRLMVPALNEVEEELRGKDVQFVSIGIDTRKFWLKGIGKYSSEKSLQLYTNELADKHPMMQYLNIYSYPRLIIVDKNGKIASDPPNPRSSKIDFVNAIKALL